MDYRPKRHSIFPFDKHAAMLVALCVLLPAFFGVVSTKFLVPFNIATLMLGLAVLFLASLGGTFVIMMGSLDVSYAGVLTFSGIVAALLLPSIGFWSMFAGIGVGAVLGLVNGLVFVKARVPSFLVTLGTLYVTLGLSNLLTPGGLAIAAGGKLDFLLPRILPGIPPLFIWAVGLAATFYFVARFTAYGWRVYAIGSNERSAMLTGVDVERLRVFTFVLSGALAGTTGILLVAYIGSASASMGGSLIFISLAAIVLGGTSLAGGVGGPHRTVLGAFIIAVILNGLSLSDAPPSGVAVFQGLAIILTTAVISREVKSSVM